MKQILFNSLLLKRKIQQSYINSGIVKEYINQTQRLMIFSPQNVWIHSSFFQDIIETNDPGGAIMMRTSSNRTLLFVEDTYFLNCTCNSYGGSIFQESGNFKMRSVCSFIHERLFYEVPFVYSIALKTYDHFQEVDYCSFSTNVNSYSHIHEGPILFRYGCISIKSLNVSQIKYEHGIFLLGFFPFTEYPNHDMQFSSFVNNTSIDLRYLENILYLDCKMNIYMCNILHNNAFYLFYARDSLTIKNSCILENNYDKLVSQSSSTFYTYLYNCTCQNATSNFQSYIRSYSIPSSSFLHALDCFQTGGCVAQYDYLEDLDPYIPDDEIEIKIESLSNLKLRKKKNYIFS